MQYVRRIDAQVVTIALNNPSALKKLKYPGHGLPTDIDHDGKFLVCGCVSHPDLSIVKDAEQIKLGADALKRV